MSNKKKRYCIAYGCLTNGNDGFFTLPKDIKRHKKWLSLLNREDLLTKKNFQPHNYFVCWKHFDDNCFKKTLKLLVGSIPNQILIDQPEEGRMYIAPKTSEKSKSEGKITSSEELQNPYTLSTETQREPLKQSKMETQISKFSSSQHPQKGKILEELLSSRHKCLRSDSEITKIQRESDCKNTPITREQEIADRFQRIIDWQKKLKSRFKGNQYESEYKLFALNLYYASPHAYRSLQTVLKLPSKATINRFKINIPPKFDDRVIKSLEFKMKTLPDIAKYCTICVGEMTLQRHLYYNIKRDEVIGFHNINGKISQAIASNAYTIMLQGIYIKWKQPIAYAFLEILEKHYQELDSWLEQIISKLSAIGITVKAITSNQDSNFDKFAKEIKNVTVDEPYLMYDGKKVFYISDVPHLIKCIRNNLIASDFHYEDKKISWEFIKQLFNHQKDKNLRLIPKITDSHIDPNNFKKMLVKYALQVFSHTMSVALHTYIDLDVISEEARPTANFMETMNNLFDVLNSSRINCKNKYQSAFRKCDYQVKVLNDALDFFSKVKSIHKSTGKNNTAHMELFINIQISITAINMLYDDLSKEGMKYIFTRRLNQDCLEILFDSIRQQSGSYTKPTPIQFQRAFSKLFVSNMLKSTPSANCEADLYDSLLQAEDIIKTFSLCTPPSVEASVICLDGETDYQMDLPKENALTYVSGYLIFKCIEKHKCYNLGEALKSIPYLGETNLFTKYKAYNKNSGFYGALKLPPKEFNHYIKNLEEIFIQHFEKVMLENPGTKLYKLLQAVLPQTPCTCFPLNYLLKLFIRLRIYTTVRLNNRRFRDGKIDIKKYMKVKHL